MEDRMKTKTIQAVTVGLVAFFLATGFGLGDLGKATKSSGEDCSKSANQKKCKKNNKKKTVFKAAAIGLAAKLIHDMVIDFKSKQVGSEDSVVKNYKAKHKALPKKPQLVSYKSSVKPGQVVKAGKAVLIVSDLEVVRGKKSSKLKIEEEISIYDNENNKKLLKSLKKPVNSKTKRSGKFKNEFKFTMPIGMPQGIYPLKTTVIVDNKKFKPADNKMQLVLKVDHNKNYEVVAISAY